MNADHHSGHRWAPDSGREDFEVHRATEQDRLAQWEIDHRASGMARQLEAQGIAPAGERPTTVGVHTTVDQVPLDDYLAQHPDERDQSRVCGNCLRQITPADRAWRGRTPICTVCREVNEGVPGADALLDDWFQRTPAYRRTRIMAEFGVDPVTDQDIDFLCTAVQMTPEGLHHQRIVLIDASRPRGR